jgi:3-amino-5-hydroxybenzoate synthase
MTQLAVNGGTPTKTKPFPPWPMYDEREMEALRRVLESRVWWRTPGTETLSFEREFSQYHQAKYGLAVTNGTHAIEVVMAALEIKPGDEVIMPDYTFVATASAVLSVGALPVLVDVERDTFNIDPQAAEAAITPNTKAIIAVHMAGQAANMDRLMEIAARHHIHLVEDCSHAHSSEWSGKKVGTFGIAGTFSFQASKTITAGEGGIILTNDDAFERMARSVQDCGRMPGHQFYDHLVYGSNYRLSEWQGALLRVQLTRLDEQTTRRHKNARLLDELLSEIVGLTPQALDKRCTKAGGYLYMFHYDRKAFKGLPPARFIEALKAEGIPNQLSYPPLSALEVFKSGKYKVRFGAEQAAQSDALRYGPFPNSVRTQEEVISIPQYALLGDEDDMHEISTAIRRIQQQASDLL